LKKLKWKPFLVPTLAFAGFFFIIGFFHQYHLPRLKSWLLVEVENLSDKHSPVRVWPKNVEITLFPMGIELFDIRILPKGELSSQIAPTTIRKISATLSIYGLFTGQLRLGNLKISGVDIKYNKRKR